MTSSLYIEYEASVGGINTVESIASKYKCFPLVKVQRVVYPQEQISFEMAPYRHNALHNALSYVNPIIEIIKTSKRATPFTIYI